MQNVGSFDRVTRIVVGLVLLAVALAEPLLGVSLGAGLGSWRWVIALVGSVLFVTGFVRFCPAYLPFGIDTGQKS